MALRNLAQRVAIIDMQTQLLENQREQNVLLLVAVALRRRRNRRRREEAAQRPRQPRRWWVKPWVRTREMQSQYANIFQSLDQIVDQCAGDYMGYVRMDRNMFAEILHRVTPRIRKNPR